MTPHTTPQASGTTFDNSSGLARRRTTASGRLPNCSHRIWYSTATPSSVLRSSCWICSDLFGAGQTDPLIGTEILNEATGRIDPLVIHAHRIRQDAPHPECHVRARAGPAPCQELRVGDRREAILEDRPIAN